MHQPVQFAASGQSVPTFASVLIVDMSAKTKLSGRGRPKKDESALSFPPLENLSLHTLIEYYLPKFQAETKEIIHEMHIFKEMHHSILCKSYRGYNEAMAQLDSYLQNPDCPKDIKDNIMRIKSSFLDLHLKMKYTFIHSLSTTLQDLEVPVPVHLPQNIHAKLAEASGGLAPASNDLAPERRRSPRNLKVSHRGTRDETSDDGIPQEATPNAALPVPSPREHFRQRSPGHLFTLEEVRMLLNEAAASDSATSSDAK